MAGNTSGSIPSGLPKTNEEIQETLSEAVRLLGDRMSDPVDMVIAHRQVLASMIGVVAVLHLRITGLEYNTVSGHVAGPGRGQWRLDDNAGT